MDMRCSVQQNSVNQLGKTIQPLAYQFVKYVLKTNHANVKLGMSNFKKKSQIYLSNLFLKLKFEN